MTAIPIAWAPLAGSQTRALQARCNRILYEGTRGRGSSEAQLMYFRQFVGRGYGQHWRGVIFDRHYKDLDDLISKSKRIFRGILGPTPDFKESKADYKWVWDTGEELAFRQLSKIDDYWNHHGQEYPFIGHNELCKHAKPDAVDMLQSCNRSSFVPGVNGPDIDPIPLVEFSTANPYGPGHNWVKRRFIDPAPPGRVLYDDTQITNPRTGEKETVRLSQIRIFGSWRENPYLPAKYIAELKNIKDPNKRKAWYGGNWDIVAGGAFDDVWCEGKYIIKPRFKVPSTWTLDRSYDHGSTRPFSVGWWAKANGEEAVLPDGSIFCPKPGSLVRFAEWYGSDDPGTDTGLMLSGRAIARGILEREKRMREEGWISDRVRPGPADNSIGVAEPDTDSIAKQMEEEGVRWTPSDKRPGSRKIRFQLLRDRMDAARTGEGPAIYVMDNCRAFIALTPTLPRDPDDMDDIDTDAEDHGIDEAGYRVLDAGSPAAEVVPFHFPR